MKVLYNVTVAIDTAVEEEWLGWMVEYYIPEVMATGMFENYNIYKVLSDDGDVDPSYSIQYFADSISKVEKYLTEYAPGLIQKHKEKYENRHVAFRTLLQQIV